MRHFYVNSVWIILKDKNISKILLIQFPKLNNQKYQEKYVKTISKLYKNDEFHEFSSENVFVFNLLIVTQNIKHTENNFTNAYRVVLML